MGDYQFISDNLSNMGAIGFIILLTWRTFSHTIPKMLEKFEASSKEARAEFRESLQRQRDDFRKSLSEFRGRL